MPVNDNFKSQIFKSNHQNLSFFLFESFFFIDLIVCFDKKHLKPVDISNNFPEPYKGRHIEASRLTNDNSNMILFAFVAGNTKEFSSSMFGHKKCESIPIGYLAQKIQQIKLLGFHPIVVIYINTLHSTEYIFYSQRMHFNPDVDSVSRMERKWKRVRGTIHHQ